MSNEVVEAIVAEIAELEPEPEARAGCRRGRRRDRRTGRPEPELVDEVVEPEPEPEPEPEAEPEPVVDEVVEEIVAPAPEPEFDPVEQAEVDEFVAVAEAQINGSGSEPADTRADGSSWERRVRTERFGRIGTTLIDRGLITNEQLDEALEVQRISAGASATSSSSSAHSRRSSWPACSPITWAFRSPTSAPSRPTRSSPTSSPKRSHAVTTRWRSRGGTIRS